MYELNKKRANTPNQSIYKQELFKGGVVFKTIFQAPDILPDYMKKVGNYDMVINTYYSQEAFNELANACGFKVVQSIQVGKYSDNSRIVSILKI